MRSLLIFLLIIFCILLGSSYSDDSFYGGAIINRSLFNFSYILPGESKIIFDRMTTYNSAYYKYEHKLNTLNPCFAEKIGSLVYPMFIYHKFIYSPHYYDNKSNSINQEITMRVDESTIDYKYEYLFDWIPTNLDKMYDDMKIEFDIEYLNIMNNAKFKIGDNKSQSFFNKVIREINPSEYISYRGIESKSILENNIDLNNKIFTKDVIEYIMYFQYFAKIIAYDLFIPEAKVKRYAAHDIVSKINRCESITENTDILYFPLVMEHGLYICACYDPRFGLIIAAKGTESRNEWSNNLQEDGVATRIIMNNFQNIFNSIQYILSLYHKQHDKYITNIAFTGHSLGGAISQQLASLFVRNHIKTKYTRQIHTLHLVTFNSAGVTPFIRDMSIVNAVINKNDVANYKYKPKPSILYIYNSVIRRRHDIVHHTGCTVFQSPTTLNIEKMTNDLPENKKFFEVLQSRLSNKSSPTKEDIDYAITTTMEQFNINSIEEFRLIFPSGTIDQLSKDIRLQNWEKNINIKLILYLFDDLFVLDANKQSSKMIAKPMKSIAHALIPKFSGIFKTINKILYMPVDLIMNSIANNLSKVSTNMFKNISYDTSSLIVITAENPSAIHTNMYLINDNNLNMYYVHDNIHNKDIQSPKFNEMIIELNKYLPYVIPPALRSVQNKIAYFISLEEKTIVQPMI